MTFIAARFVVVLYVGLRIGRSTERKGVGVLFFNVSVVLLVWKGIFVLFVA